MDQPSSNSTGGELSALINAFDWSTTSLGPIGDWPRSLATAVDIMLKSALPMALLWGRDGVALYNGACLPIVADRHPKLLGSRVVDGWPEIGPLSRRALELGFAGETLSMRAVHLMQPRAAVSDEAWLDFHYSPIDGDDGKPAGVLAVIVDVTVRVHYERYQRSLARRLRAEHGLLAEANRRLALETGFLRELLQQAPGFMAVLQGPEHVLTVANPPFLQLLGRSDIIGLSLRQALPEAEGQGFLERLDDVYRSGESFATRALKLLLRRADGSLQEHYLDLVHQPIHGLDGEVSGIFTQGIDVTERVLADERLHIAQRAGGIGSVEWLPDRGSAADELEAKVQERTRELQDVQEVLRQSQKMEAIGQLTGGIAHDFNNLLTGIMGSLDLLKRRLDSGRFSEADRFIDTAVGSAERAAGLTQRLLAFARRQSLDVKPIDIDRLILSIQELLQRTLGEQVSLAVVPGCAPWPALTDADQLENALLNLAVNARDAMPDGGSLTIETSSSRLDESEGRASGGLQAGEYVVIKVRDTGRGMEPEVIAKAFDPFFTTKPLGQGTGLGLSMIYGFVKQCGGHAHLHSEPGRGTTVSLYFPRHQGDAVEAVRDTAGPSVTLRSDGKTVLVVEDDPAVRMLVMEVLNELGYRALEAADGPSALVTLESAARIDLLVSDVGLPGLNGRQLAEIGRQLRPGLRVLFITAYAESAAVRGGFLGAGMEMVTKPFAMQALAAKIRQMIERGQ